MKQMILFASAILATSLSTAAIADPTPPASIQVTFDDKLKSILLNTPGTSTDTKFMYLYVYYISKGGELGRGGPSRNMLTFNWDQILGVFNNMNNYQLNWYYQGLDHITFDADLLNNPITCSSPTITDRTAATLKINISYDSSAPGHCAITTTTS